MNEFSHYTDEDFQSYFDKLFTKDLNTFEKHLKECEHCFNSYQAHSKVWTFIKNDLEIPALKINLAYSVSNKVFSKNESKSIYNQLLYLLFICLSTVLLYLCIHFFILFPIPFGFILLAIPLCLYLILSYQEIKLIHNKSII